MTRDEAKQVIGQVLQTLVNVKRAEANQIIEAWNALTAEEEKDDKPDDAT
jgi:hypothetical protein